MAETHPAPNEKWRIGLSDLKTKSTEQGKRLLPHLPGILGLILVSLLAGWLGGRWATQPIPPSAEEDVVMRTDPVPSRSSLPPPREELSPRSEPTAAEPVDAPGALDRSPTSAPSEASEAIEAPKRAYLGVRAKAFQQKDGMQGVKVTKVLPDSPAEKAGLRADSDPVLADARSGESGGHIIIGANGLPIRSEEDLGRLLTLSAPGNEITFVVTSADGGTYEIIPVLLDAAPERETTPGDLPSDASVSASRLPGAATAQEAEVEADILRTVNDAREERGLLPLQTDQQLQRIARLHSQDMANRRFFGHFTPEGHSVIERIHIGGITGFASVGENLFTKKKIADYPARSIVEEWMESANHRKNVLNARYSVSGVGVARGERGEIYVTQVFLAERDRKE